MEYVAPILAAMIGGGALYKLIEVIILSKGKAKQSKLNQDDRIRDDLLERIDELEKAMKKLYQSHLDYVHSANEEYRKLLIEKIRLEQK